MKNNFLAQECEAKKVGLGWGGRETERERLTKRERQIRTYNKERVPMNEFTEVDSDRVRKRDKIEREKREREIARKYNCVSITEREKETNNFKKDT